MPGNKLLAPSTYHRIVSGNARGVAPTLIRCALRLAETPYALAVRIRNSQYDSGKRRIHRLAVPVISVGNITLGGTGKTPLVAWIAQWYFQRGIPTAIVSRGYLASRGAVNDEALLLRARLPDVPHLQNPDRVAAATQAVERLGCQVVVLDDAFQHRRIARDLDIVTLDALQPFGYEHVFPRGTLREPVEGLRRAGLIVLSRADAVAPDQRQAIRLRVAQLAPKADWVEVAHRPECLVAADGRRAELATVDHRPVAAFCGIGNPAAFRHTLQQCGVRLMALREFPDHYAYPPASLEALDRWAAALDAEAVLCTEKDLVKIGRDRLGGKPLWAVRIGLDFLAGQQYLRDRLQSLLAVKDVRRRADRNANALPKYH